MSHEDDNNTRMLRDRAALLPRATSLKTSKHNKKINFCRVFLLANRALCPSCGSWPHLGRGALEEQQKQVLVLLAARSWHSLLFHRALLGAGGFLSGLEKLLGILKFFQGKEKGC